jgi:hypothetical protein
MVIETAGTSGYLIAINISDGVRDTRCRHIDAAAFEVGDLIHQRQVLPIDLYNIEA